MSEVTGGSVVAGRLEIEVESDTSGFDDRLESKLNALVKDIRARIGVVADDSPTAKSAFRTSVEKFVTAAAKGIEAKIGVGIKDGEAARLNAKLETIAKVAAAGVNAKIGVVVDEQGVKEKVAAIAKATSAKAATVKVAAEDRVTRETAGMLAKAQAVAAAGVQVPVRYDRTSQNGPPRSQSALNPYGPAGVAFRPTMILGMLSLIQPAIAMIVQSLGGLVAMAGAAGASLYGLVGVVPGITALAAALGAGLIAFTGWGGESATATRSMRALYDEVMGLGHEWSILNRAVRETTWQHVVGEIEPMANRLLPALTVGLSKVGAELGMLMRNGLRTMDTAQFQRDLEKILDLSADMTQSLGSGFGHLLLWFKDMTIAAGPFGRAMADGFEEFGKWSATLLDTSFERDAFAEWLVYVGEKSTELGRVLKNTWDALGGIFRAGRDSGDSLMATLEQVTAEWDRWANSLDGQTVMKEWFAQAEDTTRAVGTLVSELVKSIMRLSQDAHIDELTDKITAELLPALEAFLGTMGRTLGPQVVDFISNVLEVLVQLSAAGGPLATMLGAVNEMVEVFSRVLAVTPGAADALGTMLGIMLTSRGVGFIVSALAKAFGTLGTVLAGRWVTGIAGIALAFVALSDSLDGLGPVGSTITTSLLLPLAGLLLMGPKIAAWGASVTGVFARMAQRSAELRALDEGIRNVQGSAVLLGFTGDALRRTGDDADDAGRKMGRFSGAAGGLYTAVGPLPRALGSLKSAAGGLLTALGGPWGIAIGLAVGAVTYWWQENQKAKAVIEEHTAAIEANGGALSEANATLVANEITTSGARDAAAEMGIEYERLVGAALGYADDQEYVNGKVEAFRKANESAAVAGRDSTSMLGGLGNANVVAEGKIGLVNGVIDKQGGILSKAGEEARLNAEANDAAVGALERHGDAAVDDADAVDDNARAQEELTGQLNIISDAYDRLTQKIREQRELNMSAREALREQRDGAQRAREEVERLAEAEGGLSNALTKSGNGFNINDEAGRRLEATYYDLAEDTHRAMYAAIDSGKSQEEVNKVWAFGIETLDEHARAAGITNPEALAKLRAAVGITDQEYQVYLDSLKETPEKVETKADLDTDEASGKAKAHAELLKANPKKVTTKAELTRSEEYKQRLAGMKKAADANPTEVKTEVKAPGAVKSKEELDRMREAGRRIAKAINTQVGAPGAVNSKSLLDNVFGAAQRIPASKSTSVSASTSQAWSNLSSIYNMLANIRSKEVSVTTYHRNYNVAVADGAIFNADGGVHDRPPVAKYADGGGPMPMWERKMQNRLRGGFKNIEHHVAQILPAGAWRVHAEDETGGEAYIPLTPSKRRRSMQILEEVANRFGMALMPIAAQFAGGAMAMPAAMPAPPTVHAPARPSSGGTRVVFEDGSIRIENPAPEPASKTVATIARGFTIDGLFGTGD